MIDLRQDEHDALRAVSRAAAEGLTLAEVGTSYAIRLALEEFVSITKTDPQRVIITSQGKAFLRRAVYA